MTTVGGALAQARRRGVASLDAQLLLARLLGIARTAVIAGDDAALDGALEARWNGALARRAAGEPLAYLLGEKEFCGLLLEVTPDVLVPRPETELLVEWALERLPAPSPPLVNAERPTVLDLGTGSGAIAIAIARARADVSMTASDVSPAALDVARRNAARCGVAIESVESSWWGAFDGCIFGMVLSNPPYVASDDGALAALGHEPRIALTSGGDGLDALREIVAGAPSHLSPGAWLLLEHGQAQAADVRRILVEAGFEMIETRRDLAGRERATAGQAPNGGRAFLDAYGP